MYVLPEIITNGFVYKTFINTVNQFLDEDKEIKHAEVYIKKFDKKEQKGTPELITVKDIKFNSCLVKKLCKVDIKTKHVSLSEFKKTFGGSKYFSDSDKQNLLTILYMFVYYLSEKLNVLIQEQMLDQFNKTQQVEKSDQLMQEFAEVKKELSKFKQELAEVKQELAEVKQELAEVKQELADVKQVDQHIDQQTDQHIGYSDEGVLEDDKPTKTDIIEKDTKKDMLSKKDSKKDMLSKKKNDIKYKMNTYYLFRTLAHVSYDDNGSYAYMWKIEDKISKDPIKKDGMTFTNFKEYSKYYKNSGQMLEHGYLWNQDITMNKSQAKKFEKLLKIFDNLLSEQKIEDMLNIILDD